MAHRHYKQTMLFDDYELFSQLREECKTLERACYQEYVNRIEYNLNSNPAEFWKHVNNCKRSNGYPNSMHLGGRKSSSGDFTVNLFAEYFSSVYEDTPMEIPDYYSSLTELTTFNSVTISLVDVFNELMSFRPKTSSGPDGVPPLLLKECVCSLSKPLYFLFSLSLDLGVFPDYWKTSYITPIFKSGDRSDVTNYRGICIQSTMSKLFDSLVTSSLSWHCRRVIMDEQYGFQRSRSCVSNLLTYKDYLLDAFEGGRQVDTIYTDFSKAFDKVNHRLLLSKLESLGFGIRILRWLESFLMGRQQSVKINNYISNQIIVPSGVPQGSHCGPLLFLLFVNDLKEFLTNTSFLMFADDLKLFKIISSPGDCLILQADVDIFCQWATLNGLRLNTDKCSCISFSRLKSPMQFDYNINSTILKRVHEIRDLGVMFDCSLSFIGHQTSVVQQAGRCLGFINRFSTDFSCNVLKLLYCSYVRPILEYASPVWSPFYNVHINQLESVQKKFLRICSFKLKIPLIEGHTNYDLVQRMLNMCSLQDRRMQADLLFLFKLLNGYIDCDYLLSKLSFHAVHRTRSRSLFYPANVTRNYGLHSPIVRMQRNFDKYSLPIDGPVHRFKNMVKQLTSL